MRDVYYQSTGNPVQPVRLPETLPELSLVPQQAGRGSVALTAITGVCGSGLFVVLPLCFYRKPGWTWFEPFDLLVAFPVITYYVCRWLLAPNIRTLLNPVLLSAVALLFLNHRTSWPLHIAIVSGSISVFTYAFGLHWTAVCTASPLPRDVADAVRMACRQNLFLLSSLTAGGIALILWFNAPVGKLLFFTLPITACLIPLPQGLSNSRWSVLCESVSSWFGYRPAPLPGLLQSPAGSIQERWAAAISIVILSSLILLLWDGSPLAAVFSWALDTHQTIQERGLAANITGFQRLRMYSLHWLIVCVIVCAVPSLIAWMVVLSAATPVLLYAASQREEAAAFGSPVPGILANVRNSQDPTERGSLYLGRVVSDGSPVLVPRRVFEEHAHGLGDSGSGKTSLFLCPLIEQLVMAGECSVIVLDFKADTLELLATLQCAAEERATRPRPEILLQPVEQAQLRLQPDDPAVLE